MKKTLLNLLIVAIITSVALVACSKENGGKDGEGNALTINATNVVRANSNIVAVKAFIAGFEVASCKFQNNGFSLNLSTNVSEQYLKDIYYLKHKLGFEIFGIPAHFISDRNNRCGVLELLAYNNSGRNIGHFRLGEKEYHSDDQFEAYYVYTDRNFTIKGYSTYDCSFKKGWNIVYLHHYIIQSSYEDEMTTTKPSNANLKWIYEGEIID